MAEHVDAIWGRGLEVKDDRYLRLGGSRVHTVTVVDHDPANQGATLIADLAAPGGLPAGAFDCILLTQVLQLLADPAAALDNWSSGARARAQPCC